MDPSVIDYPIFDSRMNDSSAIDLQNVSLCILRMLAPWVGLQSGVSVLQLAASLCIFLSIVTCAALRTNQTYILLAHISVCDGLYSAGNIVNDVIKLSAYFASVPMISTARACMYKDMIRIWSYTNSNGLLFLLALNRLIAVAAPVWYMQGGARRLFALLLIVIYARTLGICAIYLIGVGDDPVPLCGYLPMSAWVRSVLTSISIPWLCTIAVIYVTTITVTYVRLGLVKWKRGDVSETRKQLQVRIVWTLAMILIVHISTTTIGHGLFVFAGLSHTEANSAERNYVILSASWTLISMSTVLYLPILIGRCEDFRAAMYELIKRLPKPRTIRFGRRKMPSANDEVEAGGGTGEMMRDLKI